MGLYRWIVAGLGLEAGRKIADALDDKRRAEARRRRRNVLIGVVSVVGLVLLLAAALKLLKWVIGVVFLAGVAYAAWALLGPRITARIEAVRERRARRLSARRAEQTEQDRARRIEDELSAIKRDIGD